MTINSANGLPYHVVRNIQQHLLPPDIAKSKRVSREWNEAGRQVEEEKIPEKAKELINTLNESTIEEAIKNPSPKQKSCFDILSKISPFHRKQVNQMSSNKLTPAQQAAVDYILQDTVQISYRASADVKTRNHADAGRALVLGADPNSSKVHDIPVLQWAALYGHTEIVQSLLDSGADANMADNMGDTALQKAAANGYTEVVKALLEAGARSDNINQDGNTALNEAVYNGHTEVVKALLEAGANPNATMYCQTNLVWATMDGKTNLAWAAMNGYTEIAKALIAKGANVDVLDSMGKTALDKAISRGHTEIVELLTKNHQKTSTKKRNIPFKDRSQGIPIYSLGSTGTPKKYGPKNPIHKKYSSKKDL